MARFTRPGPKALRNSIRSVERLKRELARAHRGIGYVERLRGAERRHADAALREVEGRYSALYSSVPVMLHSIDRNGRIISVSRYWLEKLGYEASEVIGRRSVDFLTEESRRYAEEVVLPEFFRTGVCRDVPYQFVRKTGETIDVLLSAVAERDGEGRIRRSLAVSIDITERKRAEDKVIKQNEFLNHVLESLTHPFYVLDVNDYTIKMANSAAAFGELTENATCHSLTHSSPVPCNNAEHACPVQMVKEMKRPVILEHVHYDKDGNPRHVEVHGYPIFDKNGNVVQMIEYTLDITDRKTMEEELRRNAERVKHFAYSVSHDLKSPIIGIHGLARLLHRQYGDTLDEKGRKYCGQILKASEQAVMLIEEINAYIKAKEIPLRFEAVRPKEVLRMVRDEFDALLSAHQLSWLEPEDIPEIRADRMSLLRVFRNLVDNSIKYGGEGLSRITIGFEESEDFFIFSVADDGVGVKKESCGKIFGLFQREEASKGIEGTGLGLAIVKEIAEKHRGSIWVNPGTETGKGVTFYFSISKAL